MQKVNVIGIKHVHKYAKLDADGNVTPELFEVECTELEHDDVRKNNQQPPAISGYEWVCSVERHKLDTPSGDLEDGQYYEHTTRVVKLAGNNPCGFDVVKNVNAGIDLPSMQAMAENVGIKEDWTVKEKADLTDRETIIAQKEAKFLQSPMEELNP